MTAKQIVETVLANKAQPDADDDELFEMANLVPRRTGLKHRVWVSVNMHQRHHRPRLKVEGSDKGFYPASIDDPVAFLAEWPPGFTASDFAALGRFVALNRAVLIQYWNDELDTETMIGLIRAVG